MSTRTKEPGSGASAGAQPDNSIWSVPSEIPSGADNDAVCGIPSQVSIRLCGGEATPSMVNNQTLTKVGVAGTSVPFTVSNQTALAPRISRAGPLLGGLVGGLDVVSCASL